MPRKHCPPSRRGHTWSEPSRDVLARLGAAADRYALRVCKCCGRFGRVDKQGVVKEIA